MLWPEAGRGPLTPHGCPLIPSLFQWVSTRVSLSIALHTVKFFLGVGEMSTPGFPPAGVASKA